MSEHDTDDSPFKNPATRQRRAWIDRALASARDTVADPDRAAPCEHDPTRGTGALVDEKPAPRPRLAAVPGTRRDR